MVDTASRPMIAAEFLRWCMRQEGERWEFVHGTPVRVASGGTIRLL